MTLLTRLDRERKCRFLPVTGILRQQRGMESNPS